MRPFDANGAFGQQLDAGDALRKAAVRGAGITVVSQGLVFALQMIATVVLARILTPKDFGLVAMVTTFSLLLVGVGLNGFTEAIQQSDEMDHFLASNLFWINLAVGLLFTLGFAAAGSLLARFFHDPLLVKIAIGISPTIFLTSISVEHLALLKRAMSFSAVSANDICARAFSAIVSIAMAFMGYGYWALVGGALAQPLAAAVGAWILCRWVPSLPRKAPGTDSMVRFAINIYGRYSFNYCTRNLDNILVGWRFGSDSLGFYKKAYDLFLLPAAQFSAPLTTVAVSALSRLQKDSARYRRQFLAALAVMALLGMWLGADLTLVGKDIIRLVLGPEWAPAGVIFTFFGPGVGMMLLYAAHGWIHLSIGTPHRWFRWVIVEFTVTALLFFCGLPWGPVGIAAAWTVSFWILLLPAFWYAGKPINLGVGPIITTVWKYVSASVIATVAGEVIVRRTAFLAADSSAEAAAIRLVVISVLCTLLYLVAVVILHGGFAPISRVFSLGRDMLTKDHPVWTAENPPQTADAAPDTGPDIKQPAFGIRSMTASSSAASEIKPRKTISTTV